MARERNLPRRLATGAGWLWRRGRGRLRLPRGRFWLRLRLPSPIPESPTPGFFGRPAELCYLDVLRALDAARTDPRVAGVLVRFHGPPGAMARSSGLRRALMRVREAGKPAVAFSERYSSLDLLAASGASHVLLPESGSVFLTGLRLDGLYLRDLLDRLGVRVDVVRAGDFKAAGEMLTRSGPSQENREQLAAIADDLFAELEGGLAEGRGLPGEEVARLVDRALFPAAAAVDAGLIDGVRYPDEIESLLLELAPGVGRPDHIPVVDAPAYLSLRARDAGIPWSGAQRIAVVIAEGGIRSGGGFRGIASEPFRALLEGLRRDEGLAGVLVRIDSPGGDAVTSDLLWRGLRRIGEERPVVASLGDVAASGGYFMASGAATIVAEAGTLTGSIGVIGGKLDASGLLERLGVHSEPTERGARAGLLSPERGFSNEERNALRDEMEILHGLFVDRVATGRGLSAEAVRPLAGGRVWSGSRAVEHALADRLGGPLQALSILRERLGLGAEAPLSLELHPGMPRLAGLARLLRPSRGVLV
ncbi:MAG: S49 family peptidase [Myxococcota bacterium]|nr:S49 family peptidase [Myxococcota bacterium]